MRTNGTGELHWTLCCLEGGSLHGTCVAFGRVRGLICDQTGHMRHQRPKDARRFSAGLRSPRWAWRWQENLEACELLSCLSPVSAVERWPPAWGCARTSSTQLPPTPRGQRFMAPGRLEDTGPESSEPCAAVRVCLATQSHPCSITSNSIRQEMC